MSRPQQQQQHEIHPADDEDRKLDEKDIAVTGITAFEPDTEPDQAYLDKPTYARFFRSVHFQMILFGALAFSCPAMTDAINKLGGGGLKSPYIANLASSLNYAASCLMSLIGGPVINKLGIKYACMISGAFYVLSGTGYYVMARFGNEPFLFTARIVGGFTNALLYVAEATAMISYPYLDERGKYLGIWTAMRNVGSILGGGISFATNNQDSTSNSISWHTYLIIIGFEATGLFWALMLSQTKNVRRRDATRVPMSESISWRAEFRALWLHIKSPRMLFMFLPAFYSFYYGGTYSTYLTLNFSVRARALSALITPCIIVVTVLLYGKFLDAKRFSLKTRAWAGFAMWLVPQVIGFIWTGVLYSQWEKTSPRYIHDYGVNAGRWFLAYVPYMLVFVTGYWCQLYLYWTIGTFSNDVKAGSRTGGIFRAFEAAGSAVTYSVNSAVKDPKIPLLINAGILVLTIPSMVYLIKLVPAAPSDRDDTGDGLDVATGKAATTTATATATAADAGAIPPAARI